MKVGTICKLKVECLGNKAGTLGVVFNDYGDGFQVIFENGNYDGFSTQIKMMGGSGRDPLMQSEEIAFLEEVGFEESLAGYKFRHVTQVSEHYRKGLFNTALHAEPEYEKCTVYGDGNRPAWLRFKRRIGPKGTKDSVQCCMLSAAMDYVDFSHFEYPDLVKRLEPRWTSGETTVCPLYVVFRKKQ